MSCAKVVPGVGDGEGDDVTDGMTVGEGEGVGVTDGMTVGEGDGVGVGTGVPPAVVARNEV